MEGTMGDTNVCRVRKQTTYLFRRIFATDSVCTLNSMHYLFMSSFLLFLLLFFLFPFPSIFIQAEITTRTKRYVSYRFIYSFTKYKYLLIKMIYRNNETKCKEPKYS